MTQSTPYGQTVTVRSTTRELHRDRPDAGYGYLATAKGVQR